MTFPTYEEWGEKVAEQVIDVYLINGRTIREWIEILSNELTMLDKIRAEIEQSKFCKVKTNKGREVIASVDFVVHPDKRSYTNGLETALQIIDKYIKEE